MYLSPVEGRIGSKTGGCLCFIEGFLHVCIAEYADDRLCLYDSGCLVYSNMGSIGPDGQYGYYGKPLAIVVRFPGKFFDTAPPPMVFWNQLFLLAAAAAVTMLAVQVWKRRRVY